LKEESGKKFKFKTRQKKKYDSSKPVLMVGAIQRVGPNFMDIRR
jgi:hypothetical protein